MVTVLADGEIARSAALTREPWHPAANKWQLGAIFRYGNFLSKVEIKPTGSSAMKIHLVLAAAMAATAFAGTAHAGFFDGNALFERCSAKSGSDLGICVGYISGVADTFEDTKCLTAGVDLRQVKDVVKQYLENHPDERHHRASSIVVAAVQKAFCKG